MQYISSDTNIWLDFVYISSIDLPFLLPYTYIMFKDAIEDEILTPKGISKELVRKGLVGVDITDEEWLLAIEYGTKYKRLSRYDRTALAIAKERKIKLLTDDKALRNAANKDGVAVIGTIGILDELVTQEHITKKIYRNCIEELIKQNGDKIRLPVGELESRLKMPM